VPIDITYRPELATDRYYQIHEKRDSDSGSPVIVFRFGVDRYPVRNPQITLEAPAGVWSGYSCTENADVLSALTETPETIGGAPPPTIFEWRAKPEKPRLDVIIGAQNEEYEQYQTELKEWEDKFHEIRQWRWTFRSLEITPQQSLCLEFRA
jgi:hypothetical protein